MSRWSKREFDLAERAEAFDLELRQDTDGCYWLVHIDQPDMRFLAALFSSVMLIAGSPFRFSLLAAVQHVRFATYRRVLRAIRCLRTSQLPVGF